jgi:hypothetical protein
MGGGPIVTIVGILTGLPAIDIIAGAIAPKPYRKAVDKVDRFFSERIITPIFDTLTQIGRKRADQIRQNRPPDAPGEPGSKDFGFAGDTDVAKLFIDFWLPGLGLVTEDPHRFGDIPRSNGFNFGPLLDTSVDFGPVPEPEFDSGLETFDQTRSLRGRIVFGTLGFQYIKEDAIQVGPRSFVVETKSPESEIFEDLYRIKIYDARDWAYNANVRDPRRRYGERTHNPENRTEKVNWGSGRRRKKRRL